MWFFYVLLAFQFTRIFGDDPVNLPTNNFNSSKVTFFLYRNNTPESQIFIDDVTKLTLANYDPNQDTFMFIHGYGGNHNKPPAQSVKEGILAVNNANVILVDYTPYSFPYRYLYNNSKMIGATCATLINFLVDKGGLKLPKLTIIGHSFGAHITAFTANNVNGRVSHIVGLDPAGPLFRGVDPIDRLSICDADHSDCIYTSPVLGINQPICNVNYFANGGALQPSCGTADDNELLFGTCSHQVAIDYYVKTLKSPMAFPSSYCPDPYRFSQESYCNLQTGSFMSTTASNRLLPGSYYVHV